jgi:hypothetical protein
MPDLIAIDRQLFNQRLLASVLYGVKPLDSVTFVSASVLLTGVDWRRAFCRRGARCAWIRPWRYATSNVETVGKENGSAIVLAVYPITWKRGLPPPQQA